MKTKYTITLSALIALTVAPCWGAAESDEEMARRINNEELGKLCAQEAKTPSDFSKMPAEVIVTYLLPYVSAADLMNLAVVRPDVYPFIKRVPKFIQLQNNLKIGLEIRQGNKLGTIIDAIDCPHILEAEAMDVVDYLTLSPYVDINAKNLNDKINFRLALMAAIDNNNLALAELLLARGADIEAKNKWGNTALIRAIHLNNPEMIQLLLDKGANINAKSNDGGTALMAASNINNPAIVEMLLARRANVNVKNLQGRTALSHAIYNIKHNIPNRHDQNYQSDARTIVDLLKKATSNKSKKRK